MLDDEDAIVRWVLDVLADSDQSEIVAEIEDWAAQTDSRIVVQATPHPLGSVRVRLTCPDADSSTTVIAGIKLFHMPMRVRIWAPR